MSTKRNSTTNRGASKRGDASQSIRGTKRGTTIAGSGARRGSTDASRPAVFDPDDNTLRTPQPLCPAIPTTGGYPGIGASTIQGAGGTMSIAGTLAEGTQLGAMSSHMQSSQGGPSMSVASGSMMAGSMMSNMSGSMISNMSEEAGLTVSTLEKKPEVPKAVDLMRAQQRAQCEALTEDEREAKTTVCLSETPTVLVVDIKSNIVRPDDAPLADATTAANTALAEVLEKKVTAADNYVPRGVNTINPILKSKLVQETAPLSIENGFQVYDYDIYDAFNLENKDSTQQEAEDEVNTNEEEEVSVAADSQRGSVVAGSMVEGATMETTMAGGITMMEGPAGSTTMNTMGGVTTQGGSAPTATMASLSGAAKTSLKEKLQTMERMVMQNIYAAKHLQYSGFDLPAELRVGQALEEEEEEESEEDEDSDEEEEEDTHIDYRLDELWSFECEETQGKNVAALAWSEHRTHRHILAVAYGETDFSRGQEPGAIMLWSLKNPNHPEHIIRTASGVISVAFSHDHPNLLAAGYYDGTVCIFDIGRRDTKPFLEADYHRKHTGPVWELQWVDQNSDRGEKLVSISSDGRITQWTMKKGLEHTDLFKLKKVINPAKQKEVKSEAFISRNASGFCFDFSPVDPQYYLCGTEEGNIHLCSRSYNHTLQTYVGHTGPVYKVKYSPHHPGLFLSASADWSCRMWHVDTGKMLLSYSPNNTPMMDVCWSPDKPTVFGFTSLDGKLQVYDIAQNQMDPSCSFELAKDENDNNKGCAALNTLAFANSSPVVITGSGNGQVQTFTIHGMSSQTWTGNPKEELEKILMMGDDLTSAASEDKP